MLRNRVEGLHEKLSQKWARTSGVFHYDLFEIRDGKLYFRDKSKPLTTRDGKLRSVKEIKKLLGDGGLRDVQTDTDDLFENPLRELLGLDTQLRSIWGSLKVEIAKKVQLEEHITKEQ